MEVVALPAPRFQVRGRESLYNKGGSDINLAMIYQVGGSLESQAPCYVERKADHELYHALQAGEFCYILNSRQVGKSSLLVRTLDRLQQAGFICTKLDITSIGSEDITPLQWYKGIIVDLMRSLQLFPQFPLKTWWEEREDLPLVQRLAQFFEELLLVQFPEQKIIIFLDEIDSTLSLPFPVDDFWALLRFFFNQRAVNAAYKRLTFALFGVATPADLIQDHRRTPFNIGRAIELTGFTLAESTPLIQGLTPLPWHAPTLYQAILDWTSGQPFLTQKICQLSLQFYSHFNEENEVDFIRHIIKQKIINNWEFQDEPEHLKTIKNHLIYYHQKTVKILEIYQQILQEKSIKVDESLEKTTLILSGLLENDHGELKIKNQIYQAIFDLQWVTKELTKFRPYSQNLQDWLISNKLDESRLLRGKSLKEAQNWTEGKSLGDTDYQFVAASVDWENRESQKALQLSQQKKVAHLQSLLLLVMTSGLLASSFLSFVTFKQYQEVRISEIKALVSSCQGLFASHQHLKSLLEAVKAQGKWQDLRMQNPRLQKQLDRTLRQAVYGPDEINYLSGHKGGVLSVDFSPDGQLIATASNVDTPPINRGILSSQNHLALAGRIQPK
jgi:hypothetical protein